MLKEVQVHIEELNKTQAYEHTECASVVLAWAKWQYSNGSPQITFNYKV